MGERYVDGKKYSRERGARENEECRGSKTDKVGEGCIDMYVDGRRESRWGGGEFILTEINHNWRQLAPRICTYGHNILSIFI